VQAAVVTDVAVRDGLVAFGDGAIVTIVDDHGATFLATTRPATRFELGAGELISPPALDIDPWSPSSIALRVGEVAVVVWAADASPAALREIAGGLRVDADALRPSDRSLEVTGQLAGSWPGPGRATSVWVGPVEVVAVPVEPTEQRVLWALMEAMHPSDDASPIEGFTAADYPSLRAEPDALFGTIANDHAALVVAGDPGVALLAPPDVERSKVDLDAVLGDLELIGPDALATRAEDLHDAMVGRAVEPAGASIGTIRWGGDVHGVHRLLVEGDDVVGYDRVQRKGPAVCVVDLDVLRGVGLASAAVCTAERSTALTASMIDSADLGNEASRSYVDVWGVASEAVSRVDVVLLDGTVVAADLSGLDAGGRSRWYFDVQLALPRPVRQVIGYGLGGEAVDTVEPGPEGDLPGFLEHPWK
jgi:hypothetical protein